MVPVSSSFFFSLFLFSLSLVALLCCSPHPRPASRQPSCPAVQVDNTKTRAMRAGEAAAGTTLARAHESGQQRAMSGAFASFALAVAVCLSVCWSSALALHSDYRPVHVYLRGLACAAAGASGADHSPALCAVAARLAARLSALLCPSAALSFAPPDEKSATPTHAESEATAVRGRTMGDTRVEGNSQLCSSSPLPVSDRVHSILFVCVRALASLQRRPAVPLRPRSSQQPQSLSRSR